MSKTLIVTLDAIETITKTAEVVVQVPDSISNQEVEDLVRGLDCEHRLGLDWVTDYQDFEVHLSDRRQGYREGRRVRQTRCRDQADRGGVRGWGGGVMDIVCNR
jgi:hypothetical protein